MPTDQDRHTRPDAVPASFRPYHPGFRPDREAEAQGGLLVNQGAAGGPRYLPLPRLIQE